MEQSFGSFCLLVCRVANNEGVRRARSYGYFEISATSLTSKKAYDRYWPLSTFAVRQQFVCVWGQTGLVIDRLNPSRMTHLGHDHLDRHTAPLTINSP